MGIGSWYLEVTVWNTTKWLSSCLSHQSLSQHPFLQSKFQEQKLCGLQPKIQCTGSVHFTMYSTPLPWIFSRGECIWGGYNIQPLNEILETYCSFPPMLFQILYKWTSFQKTLHMCLPVSYHKFRGLMSRALKLIKSFIELLLPYEGDHISYLHNEEPFSTERFYLFKLWKEKCCHSQKQTMTAKKDCM